MNLTALVIRIVLLTAILFLIDLYAFQAVKTVFKESFAAKAIYWVISFAIIGLIIYAFLTFSRSDGPNGFFQFLLGSVILFIVPKLILLVIMFGEDIIRLFRGVFATMGIGGSPQEGFLPDRRKFVSQTALILAAIPFAGVLHGIFRGRYNYKVIKKTLFFTDLPKAFDGFTITQLSDIHSGSFDNAEKIKYGIDMVNAQQSDLILFTGDLVNNRADEMEPWVELFSQLKAPLGKYSILGNHDYGDYVQWPSAAAKQANMEHLYSIHEKLGFDLLRNRNVKIEKDGETLDLIGVENWGKGFAQHGDLEKAASGLSENSFKILMSHDPSHFDEVVKTFKKFIHLTLSGHTHGMQFGIEIPGFIKWSPVKYRYPKWAGLYESLGRYLYVNRGFGYLAFPGRVGIWPEITVLELRRKPME